MTIRIWNLESGVWNPRSALLLALLAAPAHAQQAPPIVARARPLVASPGGTVALELRGAELEGASALAFDDLRVRVEGIEAKRDTLKAQVTLPAGLPPGPLGYRVVTPRGLSAAAVLMVGRTLPVVAEAEPNDGYRKPQAIATPAAVDGDIKGGNDVDVFAVDLKASTTLVAEAVADRAGSGLDALVTILGPDGRELASDDDLFGRDAACWATAPRDGRYFVQVQDAAGRLRDNNAEQRIAGRDYRLNVGAIPLVVAADPAGVRRGGPATVRLLGANLPAGGLLPLDVPADASAAWPLPLDGGNAWTLRTGDLPEFAEPDPEPAADPVRAPIVTVPAAINGRFADRPGGDVDLYRLKPEPGREGDYRITVHAARVGSPADPVLAVLDDRGDAQGEDDDKLGRDARLERTIGPDGVVIAVRDYFNRGGDRLVYRVEVEPAGRGPAVGADLGSRAVPRRGALAIPFTVERRGGEDGPITVLAGPLPPGVLAAPATVPPKGKGGVLVLTAATDAPLGAFPLRLTTRDAPAPATFAFRERNAGRDGPRELPVESEAPLLVVTEPPSLGAAIEPADVTIPPGGQAEVKVALDRRGDGAKKPVKVKLLAGDGALDGLDGPREATVAPDGSAATFTLKAPANAAPRRLVASARAWFDGGAEFLGVDAPPAALAVPEPAPK